MMLAPDRAFRATTLSPVDATTLPPGVVGRLRGVALVYEVADSYRTTFARGSLTRTMRERVASGKVKLYWNHGDAHVTGTYDTDLHVGIVRRMWDEQQGGQYVAMLEADLFDTEEGRKAHEYLTAVHAAGGETGLSIGMMPGTVRADTRPVMVDGVECLRITECGLREVSIVSEPAVPGASVTHVRTETPDALPDTIDYEPLLRTIAAHTGDTWFRAKTREILGDATDHTDSDAPAIATPSDSDAAPVDSPADATPAATLYASMADRLAVYRRLTTELLT